MKKTPIIKQLNEKHWEIDLNVNKYFIELNTNYYSHNSIVKQMFTLKQKMKWMVSNPKGWYKLDEDVEWRTVALMNQNSFKRFYKKIYKVKPIFIKI